MSFTKRVNSSGHESINFIVFLWKYNTHYYKFFTEFSKALGKTVR